MEKTKMTSKIKNSNEKLLVRIEIKMANKKGK